MLTWRLAGVKVYPVILSKRKETVNGWFLFLRIDEG